MKIQFYIRDKDEKLVTLAKVEGEVPHVNERVLLRVAKDWSTFEVTGVAWLVDPSEATGRYEVWVLLRELES